MTTNAAKDIVRKRNATITTFSFFAEIFWTLSLELHKAVWVISYQLQFSIKRTRYLALIQIKFRRAATWHLPVTHRGKVTRICLSKGVQPSGDKVNCLLEIYWQFWSEKYTALLKSVQRWHQTQRSNWLPLFILQASPLSTSIDDNSS